jgi:hypothetical protein
MSDPFSSDPNPAPPGLGFAIPPFNPALHRAEADEDRAGNNRDREMPGREEYRPMADLPVPDPDPGYAYRYVRVSSGGSIDTRNVGIRFSEGWEPVTPEMQPRIAKLLGRYGVNSDGHIEVGGLLLCRTPTERRDARNLYYARSAQAQMNAVDATYMRDQNAKMPKLAPERSSYVSGSR